MVSDLESLVTVLAIIVTLLARLRGFEIFMHYFTHFFSFCDHVIAKKLAFTRLGPIERSTTLSAIQNFECGLARSRLEAVVGELGIWKTIFPLHIERDDTSPEHVFEDLIDSLDLPTCLRTESYAEANVGAHGLLEGVPEHRSEDASMIRRYQLWNAVQGDNPEGLQLCQLSCYDRFFDWKVMSHFCELVNDNENSIISTLGLGKSSHEVHLNMVKLPFWNSKRLEETSCSLVFCFTLLQRSHSFMN